MAPALIDTDPPPIELALRLTDMWSATLNSSFLHPASFRLATSARRREP
jgi:hypothetical protein